MSANYKKWRKNPNHIVINTRNPAIESRYCQICTKCRDGFNEEWFANTIQMSIFAMLGMDGQSLIVYHYISILCIVVEKYFGIIKENSLIINLSNFLHRKMSRWYDEFVINWGDGTFDTIVIYNNCKTTAKGYDIKRHYVLNGVKTESHRITIIKEPVAPSEPKFTTQE